jgi:copper homeostasis protein
MNDNLTLEVCVDSVESAIAAQDSGAHRIELCDNMLEGGTTPSIGTITLARHHCDIPIHVMIRPRGGDFRYTEIEFEVMKVDIEQARKIGVDGVVFGMLMPDGAIDTERCTELVALARPMRVTFHRAFDFVGDPHQSLEDLIRLGVDRVLTSGKQSSALEGLKLITKLVKQANDRIIIMPGAGITQQNIKQIVRQSGVTEAHVYSAVTQPSEDSRKVTDAGRVASLLKALE